MHTITSKEVLSPLADAVSELIVIVSTSEAENSALPDLSEIASVVCKQTQTLVNVGEKLSNESSDEDLKIEMPQACAEVTSASDQLLRATQTLCKNGRSSAGRSELLAAVKGLLSGTTNVLYAFDNHEIRKIVETSQKAIKSLNELVSFCIGKSSPQEIVNSLNRTSQSVVAMVQITNKRVLELVSEEVKRRLTWEIDTLVQETPLLARSTKLALFEALKSDVGENTERQLKGAASRIECASRECEKLVRLREEKDLVNSKNFSKIETSLQKLEEIGSKLQTSLYQGQDPTTISKNYVEYSQNIDSILDYAKERQNDASDPTQKVNISRQVKNIQSLATKTQNQIQDLPSIQSNKALFETLVPSICNLIRQKQEIIKEDLQSTLIQSLLSDFITLSETLSNITNPTTIVSKLKNSLEELTFNGPEDNTLAVGTVQQTIEEFKVASTRLNELAAAAVVLATVASCDSKSSAENLDTLSKKLHKLANVELDAVGSCIDASHGDLKGISVAIENWTCVNEAWIVGVKDMHKNLVTLFHIKDVLCASRNAFDHNIAEFYSAIEQKADLEISQRMIACEAASKEFIGILTNEISNSDDTEYTNELKFSIAEVEIVLKKMIKDMQTFIAGNGQSFEDIREEMDGVRDKLIEAGLTISRNGNFAHDWLSASNAGETIDSDVNEENILSEPDGLKLKLLQAAIKELGNSRDHTKLESKISEVFELVKLQESETAKNLNSNHLSQKISELESLVARSLCGEISVLNSQLKDTQSSIFNQFCTPIDRKINVASSREFDQCLEKFCHLTHAAIRIRENNSSYNSSIKSKISELSSLGNVIANQVMGKKSTAKGNIKSEDEFENNVKKFQDNLDQINSEIFLNPSIFSFEDRIHGSLEIFDSSARNLSHQLNVCVEDRFDKKKVEINGVSENWLQVLKKSPKALENINEASFALQNLRKICEKPTNEIFKDSTEGKDTRDGILNQIQQTIQKMSDITSTIAPEKTSNKLVVDLPVIKSDSEEEEEALKLAEEMGDIVLVDGEAPTLLPESEAKENPIKAAAQEIKVQAAAWSSSENPIVEAAKFVSENMEMLAKQHQILKQKGRDPTAKKEFLTNVSNIMTWALKMSTDAKTLVSNCSDKRLRSDVERMCDRISTLASQFKIIAAVKAANPGDTDRDAQLIACAQNITDAVKNCLRGCEGASLRVVGNGTIKFRKIYYKRKQFGGVASPN